MSSEADFSVPKSRTQGDSAAQPAPWAQSGQGGAQAQAIPQPQAMPYAPGAPQVQAIQQVVMPKNPALGVILSFFIPGLGSMVNGSGGRGAIILCVYVFGWILALFLIGIPILIGAWIWGMIDGYLSAQRWNLAHGIVS